MPKTEFTSEELKQYFKKENGATHYYAVQTKEREQQMRVHSDGEFPEELINERRPNEPSTVLEYRKKIFVAKTKPYFNKIESTLQKIRRSSDWSIRYPNAAFDKVVDAEKMDMYAEYNYPVFGSITNWAFSLLLRNYLVDANALVLVAPIEIPVEENIYLKPIATIFNSSDVVDYVENDYAVLVNKLGSVYGTSGKERTGVSYYTVTTYSLIRWDQIDGKGAMSNVYEHVHMLGILPVFKLGGIVTDVYGLNTLYESRISGILPEFNEALREYSDLQAAKVLHLYPERWEYTNNECTSCKGTGQRMEQTNEGACAVTCSTCEGIGYIAAGPYAKMLIKPSNEGNGERPIPTPPAGFIEKDVEIIKVQGQSVQEHIYNALASINFEFLAATPTNQSGVAKEVDKDELNNTVHSIAEDIVRIIDSTYYLIALYRYSIQYTAEEIKDMLPKIGVPEKYDILNTNYFTQQLKLAKESNLNPAILNALEINYATKAFNNDLEVSEHVALILKLDPLSGITEDNKNSRLQNGGITKLDYVVSSNINKFVDISVETISGFDDLDTSKQRDLIYAMAQSQIDNENADLIPLDGNQL